MREEYMLIHFTNKILSRCNHFNDFEEARKRFIDICQLFISNCDKIADIEYDIIKEDNVIGFDITDYGIKSGDKEFRGVIYLVNISIFESQKIEDILKALMLDKISINEF